LAGGGDMAARIAAFDWTASLGPVEAWPQSLKTIVGFMVHTPVPLVLLWGADGIMIYNDAYSVFAGKRHPGLLGSKVRQGWPEVADFNDHVMKVGLGGGTLSYKNQELALDRFGKLEPAWMNLDYSPVIDESGKPGGVMAIVVETTEQVTAERRVQTEGARLAQTEQRLQIALSAGRGIGTWDWDVKNDRVVADARFARLYGVDPERARLGAPIAEFFGGVHPEDAARVQADVARSVATGERFNSVYRLVQPDGSVRWVEAEGQCTRDAEGQPLNFAGFTFDVTERIETQTALHESERRLRFALNAAAMGSFVWNVESDMAEGDERMMALFGLPPDGLLTLRTALAQSIDADDGPRYAAAVARACDPAGDGFLREEITVHWPDGSTHCLAITGQVGFGGAPRHAIQMAGAARDITASRKAERELRESEGQFRAFAQAMPNHVWAASPDGLLNWFNQRVYDYSGMAQGALDGMGWTAMVHPDDLEFAGVRWQASLVSGATYETEFRLRRHDGVYRWHLARAVPIRDAVGVVTSWVGTNTDIEEQSVLVEALRELKDELEQRVAERTAALQNIRIFYTYSSEYHAMLAQRDDGAFEYVEINPATLQLYGMTREDVIGRSVEEIFEPEASAALRQQLNEALRTGEPHRYVRIQNGAAIEAIATPIPAEPGERRRLTVTARDISERLNLEEQLRQAQKMEAVGQLTGGIAHDFNNLLQGITGSLDRVQYRLSEGRTNDVDRFLKAAIESANRAAALTHRLLAFSRRQTLDPRAIDANKLIGGMEDLIRRTMGPNVAMEVVGAGGLWPVRVDPSQLENSLLNLCINARDAMPDGGKLTIETANKWLDERMARERELPPGQYISLCVTDTGTGMTEDVIARAFDPFFTTKPLGQGTGLGLSMIYGFVRQSGGQVRIYSEQGRGTTMCLYLPRHIGNVDDDALPASELVERGFGETVLVVDDEPTVRMLIAEVLTENFYNVVEAGDGPSALKILQSPQRIDLMITDVGLPGGMNGRQVADAARVLRQNLKVLFITGYAENAAVGNGHLDPGMEILAKPFAMSTLGNKVREMIEK
jgi:PAS domain S-box-containing protein